MSQLNALGNEINLHISPNLSKLDFHEETILRLEWMGKQSFSPALLEASAMAACHPHRRHHRLPTPTIAVMGPHPCLGGYHC